MLLRRLWKVETWSSLMMTKVASPYRIKVRLRKIPGIQAFAG